MTAAGPVAGGADVDAEHPIESERRDGRLVTEAARTVAGASAPGRSGVACKASARDAIIEGVSFKIRRGTAADARAAADLWLRARKGAVGTIPAPIHDDDDVRRWFASHVVPGTALWIAIDAADTPVGILVLDGDWVDHD